MERARFIWMVALTTTLAIACGGAGEAPPSSGLVDLRTPPPDVAGIDARSPDGDAADAAPPADAASPDARDLPAGDAPRSLDASDLSTIDATPSADAAPLADAPPPPDAPPPLDAPLAADAPPPSDAPPSDAPLLADASDGPRPPDAAKPPDASNPLDGKPGDLAKPACLSSAQCKAADGGVATALCCNGACVDGASDVANCGGCGHTCASQRCGVGFSASMAQKPGDWSFNGTAAWDGAAHTAVLTALGAKSSAGSIVYVHPVVTDAFEVTFDVRIGTAGGTQRADGLGFVLQKTGIYGVGTGGAGLGMAGLAGWGVELDILDNEACGDSSANHVGVDLLSPLCDPKLALMTPLRTSPDVAPLVGDLADGQWRTVKVRLAAGALSVSVAGVPIPTLQGVTLPGFTPGESLFFGFGGGTGAIASRQEVRNVAVTFPSPRCL